MSDPIAKFYNDTDTVWPPAPLAETTTSDDAGKSNSFNGSGIVYHETVDCVVIENLRARRSSIAVWISQAFVLGATIWIQYGSMLWFKYVWGFRGRAVELEVALQAIVWIGMAVVYVSMDIASYRRNCRFQATFDRENNSLSEGSHSAGPLSRIAAIDVRGQSSLFSRWYEVRMLLARSRGGAEIDYRTVDERCLGTFRDHADADRLAASLTNFLGSTWYNNEYPSTP